MAPSPRLGMRQIKYREQPILSLGAKQFQLGISPGGAHSEMGILYKADGITPIAEPGVAQSANNGLLMPGPVSTGGLGTPTGSIMGSCPDIGVAYTSGGAFFVTDANHILKLQTSNLFSSSLADIRTVAGHTLTPGILTTIDASGNKWLLYKQVDQLGRFDGTTFTDNWQPSLSADYFGAMHKYFDTVVLGNGAGQIATISNAMVFNGAALAIPKDSYASAISDDGTYVVIAITRNIQADTTLFVNTRILFWDAFASSWLREFVIPDPFIYSLRKTTIGTFAFGITGIWHVTFRGIKKILSIAPGVYTLNGGSTIHYGPAATSFFGDALMWGGTSGANNALKTLGQLDSSFKSAYLTPTLLTAGKNITAVDAQLLKGWVYVADSTPQLLAYPMGTNNAAQTGNSAQTVYFSLKERFQVNRVDVIFGVPLASVDSFSVSLLKDENTAAIATGTATFAADGAIRRKPMFSNNPVQMEEQLSIKMTWNAGTVKVKRIDVYGHWMTP